MEHNSPKRSGSQPGRVVTPEHARKGKAKSPWAKGPMCSTPNGRRSFEKYLKRGETK